MRCMSTIVTSPISAPKQRIKRVLLVIPVHEIHQLLGQAGGGGGGFHPFRNCAVAIIIFDYATRLGSPTPAEDMRLCAGVVPDAHLNQSIDGAFFLCQSDD